MIALEAYASDCRLFGSVDLGDGRLTDLLNASPELRIHDARLESLADGHVVETPELLLARDELCAVVAAGPRGDTARRVRTYATLFVVDLGPYEIVGVVHSTSASDPLGAVLRRAAWVPMTDASISYRRGPATVTEDVDVLLVNRNLTSLFRATEGRFPVAHTPEDTGGPEIRGLLHATPNLDEEALAPSPPRARHDGWQPRVGGDSGPRPAALVGSGHQGSGHTGPGNSVAGPPAAAPAKPTRTAAAPAKPTRTAAAPAKPTRTAAAPAKPTRTAAAPAKPTRSAAAGPKSSRAKPARTAGQRAPSTRTATAGPTPARTPALRPKSTRGTSTRSKPTRTTGKKALAAPAPTAFCPYCALLLVPPPTASRRCLRCRQRIIVKRVEGHAVYLTEAAVLVFEAERQRVASAGRLTRDRERWLRLAAAAGAPAERTSRLAAASLSEKAVDAARKLYLTTVDRAFRAAKRDHLWETASRIRRDQAAVLYRVAGSPLPPPADVLATYREGVAAELRGVAEVSRDAELVSAACCDICRADDRRIFRIANQMRVPRLPHEGCPKGLCRCGWDLATRDRTTMRRYLRRRSGTDPQAAPDEPAPTA